MTRSFRLHVVLVRRLCARRVGEPGQKKQVAMRALEKEYARLTKRPSSNSREFDEVTFRRQLESPDIEAVFAAVTEAWLGGAPLELIDLAMNMHCIDRLLRAGYGESVNWANLKQDLMAAANIRKLMAFDETLAIKSAYHVAWLLHSADLNGLVDVIPVNSIESSSDPNKHIEAVIEAVLNGDPVRAIGLANSYAESGTMVGNSCGGCFSKLAAITRMRGNAASSKLGTLQRNIPIEARYSPRPQVGKQTTVEGESRGDST